MRFIINHHLVGIVGSTNLNFLLDKAAEVHNTLQATFSLQQHVEYNGGSSDVVR